MFGKQAWGTLTSLVEEKKPATVTVEVAGAETEDAGIADLLETLTDICDALKDDCISWGDYYNAACDIDQIDQQQLLKCATQFSQKMDGDENSQHL